MRKIIMFLAGFLALSFVGLNAPKDASAQLSIGIGKGGVGVHVGRPGPRGPVFHPGRGYYHRGGYYPFYHGGQGWRYRHNGIHYNYYHNGRYFRYYSNGRHYNWRHKGRYYASRERRCRTKPSGKTVCWWHYYN